MTFTAEFDPRAEKEYFEAWEWYEQESDGLGDRFGNSVVRQIEIIRKAPLAFPSKRSGFRECKVLDFPYLVIYKIYPAQNLIYVTSIFHTSRNPKKKYIKSSE